MTSQSSFELKILEVENTLNINLQKLFKDLANIEQKKLTDLEKDYLCCSLLGNEPIEISTIKYYEYFYVTVKKENPYLTEDALQNQVKEKIRSKAADIRGYMAKTINSYISQLMYDHQEKLNQNDRKKRPNWLKIVCFLINNGYKKKVNLGREDQNIKIIIIETEGYLQFKNIVYS